MTDPLAISQHDAADTENQNSCGPSKVDVANRQLVLGVQAQVVLRLH